VEVKEEVGPGTVPCTLRQFLAYFLRLGTFGFGGPIALAGYMQRDLVEQRRWVSKQDYVEGLAFAQLCPGPLAAQLAMYLGWVRAGALGATLVSAAFIGPSFLMVLALAVLYLYFQGLWWMQGAFYGVGAAVIAILGRSAFKCRIPTRQTSGEGRAGREHRADHPGPPDSGQEGPRAPRDPGSGPRWPDTVPLAKSVCFSPQQGPHENALHCARTHTSAAQSRTLI
jgi:chromate transport protein ChrA